MKSSTLRLNTGVSSLVDVPVGNLETHCEPLSSVGELPLMMDAVEGAARGLVAIFYLSLKV